MENETHLDNTTIVNLIDQNCTLISNILSGSLLILVKNIVSEGPSATFLASKSERYTDPCITRLTCTRGSINREELDIEWYNNSGIMLKKTRGNNHNGEYLVKYIHI